MKNTVDALKAKGLAGDVGLVELGISKGSKFSDENFVVRNGLIVSVLNNYAPISLDGYKNMFIRIIEL